MEWEPIPLEDVDAAKRRRRRLWAVAVLGVLALAAVVVVAGQDGDGGSEARDEVAVGSTTSTTIDPRRDPELEKRLLLRQACRLQDNFTIGVTSLNIDSDPVILDSSADLMLEALREMARLQQHPELVADAEILLPVIEALTAELSINSTADDVARIASDSRFAADPEVVDATMRIVEYELDCEGVL